MERSQHSRPLWLGLLACASLPVLLLVALLLGSPERVMIPVELVVLFSLPVSLLATCCVALPYALWLWRRGKLNAIRLCIAGALVGGIVMALFNYDMNYFPQMNDQTFARQIALNSAIKGGVSGAVLGLLSAIALCVGAGITIRSSRTPIATRL